MGQISYADLGGLSTSSSRAISATHGSQIASRRPEPTAPRDVEVEEDIWLY